MQTKKKPKVAVGMSGGVDSSLSAHLLLEQGYDVTGIYLECWSASAEATADKRAPSTRSGCTAEQDRKDALKVALELGIPFQVLDFKKEYTEKVVEDFFRVYEAGKTPNPDVLCNKEIKFGLFYDWAMENGFDYVATGHYAGIGMWNVESRKWKEVGEQNFPKNTTLHTPQPTLSLLTSKDSKKDQTYFLYRLRQDQLSHILFPIGHLTKTQVRQEALRRNIPVAEKPDSQGICFIGEINVHNFLKERLGENPGEVVNTSGEVMGRHDGLWFYTIGQRHGFEIFGKWKSKLGELKHAMPPYYVIRKIPEKNQLVVGFGAETFCSEFEIEDIHFINDQFSPLYSGQAIFNFQNVDNNLFVRIRHGGKLTEVTSYEFFTSVPQSGTLADKQVTSGTMKIVLAEPVQGIAEGQSAVFYENVECGVWNDGEMGENYQESRIKNQERSGGGTEKDKSLSLGERKPSDSVASEGGEHDSYNLSLITYPLVCLGGGVICG